GHLLPSTGGFGTASGHVMISVNLIEEAGSIESHALWLLLDDEGNIDYSRKVGKGREVALQLIPASPGKIAVVGSTHTHKPDGDVLFWEGPENWWSLEENCLSQSYYLEPASIAWTDRTQGASTSPWLSEPLHQMVHVPYFMDYQRPLCCPEKDSVYAKVCLGEDFQGFSASGVHQYLIDTIGNCGVERTLFLEVEDTVTIIDVAVTPSDCNTSDGSIFIQAEGDSLLYALSGLPSQPNALFNGLPAGVFRPIAENTLGCTSEGREVVVGADCPVYLPSAFSPNGDGVNDVLKLFTATEEDALVLSFRIFDRYGGLIFESNGAINTVRWDGTVDGEMLNPGVYTCVARVQLPLREIQIYQGVQLIR
ncbi:MAG: gliding motility-associated C-terminal domain-containing protein, partial [Mameliella sp.]|nr:gliding motility-associated C-terminal domain-containing protein [Phaeodactylibacter sp.]